MISQNFVLQHPVLIQHRKEIKLKMSFKQEFRKFFLIDKFISI